jgi:hypothetical protein
VHALRPARERLGELKMRLFHRSPASGQILARGFRDATLGYPVGGLMLTGVWLSDQPLDGNEGAKGTELLEVTFPNDVDLRDFEVVEDGKPTASGAFPRR